MDWQKALNLGQALTNVRADLIGDWYRDPWGWPEFEFIATEEPTALTDRASGSGVRRVANIDVPKEGFATRPAVVMEPVDRLLFQSLTDRISRSVTVGIEPWVFGWRLRRKNTKPGEMARNDFEWEAQRAELANLVGWCTYGFKTDIVSCFASMPIDLISEEIDRKSNSEHVVERTVDMLNAWDGSPGRRGLPQRNMASSLLANMYLMSLDEVIADYNAEWARNSTLGMREGLSTRWMDDIWVFGQDEGRLRALQVDLQAAARELKLELNSAKTALYEGDALAEAALRINHSAVEEALKLDTGADKKPLEELLDHLISNPEEADRTSIHFACVRMRQQDLKSRVNRLISVAHRMPHGADHISRVMRGFGAWSNLFDWYLEYLEGDWSKFDWSSAQFVTMFPSKKQADQRLVDALLGQIEGRPELPMFAVAVQRLIKWSPDSLRDLVRKLEDQTDHPLERRVLALASLALGESRARIRNLLGAYEENALTLRMVANRNFRALPVAKDFG